MQICIWIPRWKAIWIGKPPACDGDELLDTFERMVAYAAEQNVRVILIAGDLFDKPNVRKTAKTV